MRRVLFVDDEPRVLDGLRDMMRRHRRRWEMVFALGAEAAMDELRAARFDVVVSDMRMPKTDGATLLAWVKREYPQAVRIILSGYTEQEAALRAIPVAHQFLNKPCDAATLENTVERACNLQTLISDDKVRDVVGRIDSLPSLPEVYTALIERLNDQEATTAEIAGILERDMAMCAKLLQLVNSAFFGLPRRVTCIEEAVTFLGQAMIGNLALSLSIFRAATCLPRPFLEALMRQSLLTGRIGRQIASSKSDTAAQDAFVAGLLHDIGILVLAVLLPDYFEQALESLRARPRALHQVEQELWGVTHAEIGAYLLGLWALPQVVVEAVAYHHRPGEVEQKGLELPTTTHIADALAQEIDGSMCTIIGATTAKIDDPHVDSLGVRDSLEGWRDMARSLAETPAGNG